MQNDSTPFLKRTIIIFFVFGARTQVLPGVDLPRGTVVVSNGFNLVFPGIVDEPDKSWMGNPVRAVDMRDVPAVEAADAAADAAPDARGYIRL